MIIRTCYCIEKIIRVYNSIYYSWMYRSIDSSPSSVFWMSPTLSNSSSLAAKMTSTQRTPAFVAALSIFLDAIAFCCLGTNEFSILKVVTLSQFELLM